MNEHAYFPFEDSTEIGLSVEPSGLLGLLFGETTPGDGAGQEQVSLSQEAESKTDVPPEIHPGAIEAPYWADRTDLMGMGLAVQRVKRIATELAEGATFDDVAVETVYDGPEDNPASTLALLTVRLPASADPDAFMGDFFARVAEELGPDDLTRLALRVE